MNPGDVTDLFCPDGILWGTVSRIIRQGYDEIKDYFNYFARIPGLRVVSRDYNISNITNSVYVNNANIDWMYNGINTPLMTRMTFIYRKDPTTQKWCLYELHSSELPEINPNVKALLP